MDLAVTAAWGVRLSKLEETLSTASEPFDGSEVDSIFSEVVSTAWELVRSLDWRFSSSTPSLRFLEERFNVEAVKRMGNREQAHLSVFHSKAHQDVLLLMSFSHTAFEQNWQ